VSAPASATTSPSVPAPTTSSTTATSEKSNGGGTSGGGNKKKKNKNKNKGEGKKEPKAEKAEKADKAAKAEKVEKEKAEKAEKAETEVDEKQEDGGNTEDILSALKSSAVEYFARSAFSALSGKGDRFETSTELSDSLRRGVFLDRNLLSTLECSPDSLNAYIYDFYTHKSTKALIKYNHMRRGTLYDTLKDFMLLCKALAAALIARVPSSPVAAEFKLVADEFAQIFYEYGHLH
jgi:hypothetical protein